MTSQPHPKTRAILLEIIAALLIILFLYAGISKLLDMKEFEGDLNNQPFPNWITPYLVWGLPSLEIIISVCLLFEKTRLSGLWASFILMFSFTLYTAFVLLNFFPYVPCSCGGIIKMLTWQQHLILNLFYTSIALLGILLKRRQLLSAAK